MTDLAHSPISRLIDLQDVREFQTPDEIEALPAYIPEFDPRTTQIDKLLGWYGFGEPVRCGCSDCHHPHKLGYVGRTVAGHAVRIGNICGEEYFGDTFRTLRNELEQAKRRQTRRATIADVLSRAVEIFAQCDNIKNRKYGASWVNRSHTNFKRHVPPEVMDHIRTRARTGDVDIKETRVLDAKSTEVRRMLAGHRERDDDDEEQEMRVEVTVARIEGLLVWQDDLKRIIVDDTEEKLRALQRTDVLQLSGQKLLEWARWADAIPARLQRAEELIAAGRAFFTEENVNKLKRLKLTPEAARVMRRIRWDAINCAPRAGR